jgi:trehalose transport system substrate-binding protein
MTNSTLGVYPGTAGPVNGNHLLGGDVLVIPKGATNLPAIETLAKFLLSAQAQKETLLNLSWVAVNSAAYQNLPADFSQVGNALQQAISQGVFLRNPTPWITIWNAYASKAFYQIIVNHASFSQIPSILGSYNQEMYSYLQTNYNSTVASTYESGGYQPISV